jgi:hypothetical protein
MRKRRGYGRKSWPVVEKLREILILIRWILWHGWLNHALNSNDMRRERSSARRSWQVVEQLKVTLISTHCMR